MAQRRGVFISHVSEDRAVALVLKKHLLFAFGEGLSVFVATDNSSMPIGQPWYENVIRELQQSAVAIVLISSVSHRRSWITFEVGFALSAGARVIAARINQFPIADLAYPLAGLQGLAVTDVGQILDNVSGATGIPHRGVDIDAYLRDLNTASAQQDRALVVEPFLEGGGRKLLYFTIENQGDEEVELLKLEILLDEGMLRKEYLSYTHMDNAELGYELRGDTRYRSITVYSSRHEQRDRPAILPRTINKSAGIVRPKLNIPIIPHPSPHQANGPLFIQMHLLGVVLPMEQWQWHLLWNDYGGDQRVRNAADVCSREGRYSEAKRLYRRLLVSYEASLKYSLAQYFLEPTAEILDQLALLAEQTGQSVEGDQLRARATALRARKASDPERT